MEWERSGRVVRGKFEGMIEELEGIEKEVGEKWE